MVETGSLPTKNFLTRISELKLESGTTGSARVRRLFLPFVGTHATDTHGSLATIAHFELPDATTTDISFQTIPLPTDYVVSTVMTINWLYSNEGTTGDIRWGPFIQGYRVDDIVVSNIIYAVTTDDTVPTVANKMAVLSKSLTLQPNRGDFISGHIRRSGSAGPDSNSSSTQLYCLWIDYLAHS